MICLLSFTSIPEIGAFKFIVMGGFSIPAVIFFLIGAAVCHFENWKSVFGVVLLSGTGFNLLVIITFICLQLSADYREYFPDNKLMYFSDYLSGVISMIVLAGTGVALIKVDKQKMSNKALNSDA